ncbi:MAG: hypothetical protein SCM11_00710 [Bacillota bacterium]|nr:hypothetical protein [Bacillota bacterium]
MAPENSSFDPRISIRRITPAGDGKQYFFGYYDIPAFSGDGRYHLVNRVAFRDRLPEASDTSELCLIDLASDGYPVSPIARTAAWNFQQGSLLQWYPEGSSEQVLFNDWNGAVYQTVIRNIGTGAERRIDRPVANVSPDGRWGLSLNFDRIWNFRPGYGYCNRKDAWYDDPQPEMDGIWLVDLTSGSSRLLASYARIGALFNQDPALRARKIVVNHITFNRTSDRFLFLVRYFPESGGHWLTGLGTADLDGSIYLLRPYTYASHYHWRDDQVILIHADGGEGHALYELTDQAQAYTIYDRSFFDKDIHCSYSPDRRWIVGDGYPDKEGFRAIQLYDRKTQSGFTVGRFLSPPVPITDIRCDLHVRWSPDGRSISFDSTHEGFRGVYLMDLGEVINQAAT